MSATDEIIPVLGKLRMSGIDLRLRQALNGDLRQVEFLRRLLTDELERRESKQTQLRLGRARFEHRRTIEDFNFAFNPTLPKAKILDLCTGRFLDSHTNILLVGPAGVGKSHVAQAVGHRACLAGRRVLYTTAHRLFTALREPKAPTTAGVRRH